MLNVSQFACEACGGAPAGAAAAIPAVESKMSAAATAADAILDPITRMQTSLIAAHYPKAAR
jgi:hypothetical protein